MKARCPSFSIKIFWEDQKFCSQPDEILPLFLDKLILDARLSPGYFLPFVKKSKLNFPDANMNLLSAHSLFISK